MRYLAAVFISLLFLATQAFASSNGQERWRIYGYYGVAAVSPSDINGLASAQSTTPKLNSLSTDTMYGGGLGYILSPRWEFRVTFDLQDAKNPAKVTSPYSQSAAGFELVQDEVWADLDYYLFNKPHVFGYLGAGVGYPTYSHINATLNTTTSYDADKAIGGRGEIGVGVKLGKYVSLFVEGGYQYLSATDFKTGSTVLKNTSGTNATMNLSGIRGLGGLAINF